MRRVGDWKGLDCVQDGCKGLCGIWKGFRLTHSHKAGMADEGLCLLPWGLERSPALESAGFRRTRRPQVLKRRRP